MTRCGAIAGLAAALLLPATAIAQDEPPSQSVSISAIESDAQATVFKVDLLCSEPVPHTSNCDAALRLTWRQADRRTYKRSGDVLDLATVQAVVPVGAHTLEVRVPSAKLRDVTARKRVAAEITGSLVDAGGAVLDSNSLIKRAGAWDDRCGGPDFPAFEGGSADEVESAAAGKDVRTPIVSGELPGSNWVVVGPKPISFRILGVTYTVAAGSKFKRYCASIGAVKGARPFPGLFLEKGSVRVDGKPSGRGYASNIMTYEGALGSRVQEDVDFKVTRNARRQVSRIKVAKGKTTAITPWNSRTRSPCTSGTSLSVDRGGRIKKS